MPITGIGTAHAILVFSEGKNTPLNCTVTFLAPITSGPWEKLNCAAFRFSLNRARPHAQGLALFLFPIQMKKAPGFQGTFSLSLHPTHGGHRL